MENKLAAQLKNKLFGLVGRITSCGRAGKDSADVTETKSETSQPVEIRSRGGPPPANGGATSHIHDDSI